MALPLKLAAPARVRQGEKTGNYTATKVTFVTLLVPIPTCCNTPGTERPSRGNRRSRRRTQIRIRGTDKTRPLQAQFDAPVTAPGDPSPIHDINDPLNPPRRATQLQHPDGQQRQPSDTAHHYRNGGLFSIPQTKIAEVQAHYDDVSRTNGSRQQAHEAGFHRSPLASKETTTRKSSDLQTRCVT